LNILYLEFIKDNIAKIAIIKGKCMRKLILIVLSLLIVEYSYSQSEAGAVFLLIPPSPTLNGMGEIGVCLPSSDPISSYFNPANGLQNYEGLGLQYEYVNSPWLSNLADDMSYSYRYAGLSLPSTFLFDKAAISYANTYLDLGDQIRTDEYGNELESFNSYMKSDMLTLSIMNEHLFNTGFTVAAGVSVKNTLQYLSPPMTINDIFIDGRSRADMMDFGVLLSYEYAMSFDRLVLNITPTYGQALLNVGDSISFGFPGKADPTPRTCRTGISIKLDIRTKSGLSLMKYQGGRSASDLLVAASPDNDGTWSYQSGFGDIDFTRHVLQSKPDDGQAQVERGEEITFLDIVSFRSGRRIDNWGRISLHESGYGIKSRGMLNTIYALTGYPLIDKLNRHISLEYNMAKWSDETGPLSGTEYSAYTVSVNNLLTLFSDPGESDRDATFGEGFRYSMGISALNAYERSVDPDTSLSYTPEMGYHVRIETDLGKWRMGVTLARHRSLLTYTNTYVDPWGDLAYSSSWEVTLYDYYSSLSVLRRIPYGNRLQMLYGLNVTHNMYEDASSEDGEVSYDRESSVNTELILGVDVRVYRKVFFQADYFFRLFPEKDLILDEEIHLHGLRFSVGIQR